MEGHDPIKEILQSKKGAEGKYLYSDLDYIFLAKVVEKITGQTLDKYVAENFYVPMNLRSIGFHPLEKK